MIFLRGSDAEHRAALTLQAVRALSLFSGERSNTSEWGLPFPVLERISHAISCAAFLLMKRRAVAPVS